MIYNICNYFRYLLKPVLIATTLIVAVPFNAQICRAESDLEDKISKYADDPISKWDELGQKEINVSYIIAKSLGRINLPDKDLNEQISNSVVVGTGAKVGDIYNINLDSNKLQIKSSQ